MKNLNKIKKYIDIIDNHINDLTSNRCQSCLTPRHNFPRVNNDTGLTSLKLSKKMELDKYNENELILMHSMTHLFKDSGAIGLSKENIKELHDEIVLKLSSHQIFDSLDEEIKC